MSNDPVPNLPVPNSSFLARFYVENKVLLDRLIGLILAAVLSYFGFDKLNAIEKTTKENTVVSQEAVVGTKHLVADRTDKAEDRKAVVEAEKKLEVVKAEEAK